MEIKDGVVLAGLKLEMRTVLIQADRIWKDHKQELVITEGLGGTHSAGSLHYYGYAVDLRSRYFSADAKADVIAKLKAVLGCTYDVIGHSTHIHVEYDPF